MANTKCLRSVLLSWALTAFWAAAVFADTATQEMAKANGDFALKLYREIKDSSSNLFFSPFSISSALGMTYVGANRQTKSQMEEALSFNRVGSDSEVHSAFQSLLEALADPANNYTLDIANRLFGSENFEFLPAFLNTVMTNYKAPQENLDFEGNPEDARVHINQWVEDQTNDKIKDLLPEGSIDRSTVMVLVNAIYFKGLWTFPFDPENTQKLPFYKTPSSTVQMDMMKLEKKSLKYYEHSDWDCTMVELPYGGNKASMVILLPNEKDGLSRIEDSITIDSLLTAIANMTSEDVLVTIPKFKLTQRISLKAFLSEMGMRDIFDPEEADLSGMSEDADLYVTEVMHKAYVDVNEEGTEAAGATGVVVGVTSVQPQPKVFLADRPFIFILRDRETGSILFLGRLAEPPLEARASIGSFGAEPGESKDTSTTTNLRPAMSYLALITTFTAVYIALSFF